MENTLLTDMTVTSPSAAEATRQNLSLAATPGLPPLPHIPNNIFADALTPEQQEANLLHVALWIVERDQENLKMNSWHDAWANEFDIEVSGKYWEWCAEPSYEEGFHSCGTAHCLAGFAQAMAGEEAFATYPLDSGRRLLGMEATSHFNDDEYTALRYLKEVIARNS